MKLIDKNDIRFKPFTLRVSFIYEISSAALIPSKISLELSESSQNITHKVVV